MKSFPGEISLFLPGALCSQAECSIDGTLTHVHILSVLIEAEGESPKGMCVAALVLVFHHCTSSVLSCSSDWCTAGNKIPKIKLEIRSATVSQFQLF